MNKADSITETVTYKRWFQFVKLARIGDESEWASDISADISNYGSSGSGC